ncbi:hypothetical protein ACQEVG_17110 [Streptomyces sp. CA-135486]|uniref:hypothetical protein n=1 Tax=Streptomyces sp. CA-135486 TaxID=3240049 RepID=UPI003D940C5D
MGAVPAQVRRQADNSRTSVDFFVALLCGHAAVAAFAVATLGMSGYLELPIITVVVLVALIPLWYRSAVIATDEWAASVRALVNLGRKPLAEALGLTLPESLADERTMWQMVTRMSRRPYHSAAEEAFAPYRAGQADSRCPMRPPAPPQ